MKNIRDFKIDHYANKDDFEYKFWKRFYIIHVTSQDIMFAVNSDNAQDALDWVIDYCEENIPGLLMEREEEEEEEYLEDYYCGGNSGRYLNSYNIRIEEVSV